MKKKPLTNYPSIPPPKVENFTLPELASELLKSKQFIKGLQNLFSTCVITTAPIEPNILSHSANISKKQVSQNITSPTSSYSSKKGTQKLTSPVHNISQQLMISEGDGDEQYQFAFQHQAKNKMMYPWMSGNEQLVECKFLADQITDTIEQTIETSLHKILNKQFINVTNEILAMRQQLNIFTKEQLERSDNLKNQVQRQIQKMQKKLMQQQHISTSIINQPLQRFGRSKAMLNGSFSQNTTKQSNIEKGQQKTMSVHHQMYTLKKEVQNLKKNLPSNHDKFTSQDILKHIEEKIAMIEQKLGQIILNTKLSSQQQKQKCKKNYELLYSQLSVNNSKEFMSQQVKKSVKSNLKIYLDQIMKSKKDIDELYERIDRNDKGMQDYMGNQLKNVWTLVSGIKIRLQNIQEQCGVGLDQSFAL